MSAPARKATPPPATEIDFVDGAARLRRALSPLRRRILAALGEADSATGLGATLGLSRQRVNYHLRVLEADGFVRLAETRQRRGCTERRMKITARAFVVDPSLLPTPGTRSRASDRASSAVLLDTAAKTLRDVAALDERARRSRRKLLTASLDAEVALASPAAFSAFTTDLARLVAELVAKHHEPGTKSHTFRLSAAVHPAVDTDTRKKRTRKGTSP